MVLEPGSVWWAYVSDPPKHPVIIVSREKFNRGEYVSAVLLTTNKVEARKKLPNCVFFARGEFGLPDDCVAQAETFHLLEKSDIDVENDWIGQLDDERFRDLVRAIGYVICSDCEPAADWQS